MAGNQLYLTSAFRNVIQNPEFRAEAKKDASNKTVAFIEAAGAQELGHRGESPPELEEWVDRAFKEIEAIGGRPVHLDLRDGYRPSADELDSIDAYYVGGGNVFVLLHVLDYSGVAADIQKRKDQNRLKYIAESAGSVAAASTLGYVPHFANIEIRNVFYDSLRRYCQLYNVHNLNNPIDRYQGLGLTDVKIIPHQPVTEIKYDATQHHKGRIFYLRDDNFVKVSGSCGEDERVKLG